MSTEDSAALSLAELQKRICNYMETAVSYDTWSKRHVAEEAVRLCVQDARDDTKRLLGVDADLIRSLLAEKKALKDFNGVLLDANDGLGKLVVDLQTENERHRNLVECTSDHDDLIRENERLRTHKHCDLDPIECSVQALQGEYDERGRKLTALAAENKWLQEDLGRVDDTLFNAVQRLNDTTASRDSANYALRRANEELGSTKAERDNARVAVEAQATAIKAMKDDLAATEAVAKELQNTAFRVVSNRHNADLGHSHLKLAIDDLAQLLERLYEEKGNL